MSAARVLHIQQGADDAGAVTPCPKSISGTAQTFSFLTAADRDVRRAVFVAILADGRRRGAIASVARAWGVSTTMVKRVRDGFAPLTDERISALPVGLRAAVEALLTQPVQMRLPGL